MLGLELITRNTRITGQMCYTIDHGSAPNCRPPQGPFYKQNDD